MRLVELLSPKLIRVPLQKRQKGEVIEELVDMLVDAGKITDKTGALTAVLEREKVMSTAVGDGVAIPHGKTDGLKEVVASLGISHRDIDFNAIDENPVHIVFLIVAPSNATGPHLKALSRVSRLLSRKSLREKLLQAKTSQEVLQIIGAEEKKYYER